MTCTLKCRRRSFITVSEDEAKVNPNAVDYLEGKGLVILASCTRRECRRRAGIDKTIRTKFCSSNKCEYLTDDSPDGLPKYKTAIRYGKRCRLATRHILRQGRLSFVQPKGTLRMNRDKTQGMTYRKFG